MSSVILSTRSLSRLYSLWTSQFQRQFMHTSVARAAGITDGEKKITKILVKELEPTFVEVKDISGGCGSMYEISIDSDLFKGKKLLQQHQMVNKALGEEVKSLHGLTIRIGNSNDS